MPSIKETLYRLVDSLSEQEAEELLDYLNMRADPDVLTNDELARVERARAEIESGERVTLQEIQQRLGE